MTIAALPRTRPAPTLDYNLLSRGFLYLAAVCALAAPFSTEPLAFAAGGATPWLIMRIVGTPSMPSAVAFFFVWQWAQIFARVLQAWVDGETLGGGFFGPHVVNAYWYMLASLVVLAAVFRGMLGNIKAPAPAQRNAYHRWQINDLLSLYAASALLATAMAAVIPFGSGAAQPVAAFSTIKVVAMFMLFAYSMSTGRGTKIMLGVVLFEIGLGFSGLFSDFRSVFVYLAIAGVAGRVKWRGSAAAGGFAGLAALTVLALFWTSVKMDYRTFASQSDESQNIVVPLSERMAYLGAQVLAPQNIDLGQASYLLLIRLAYVDIFGSVIDVQEASPEPMPLRQWREAVEHVITPRILFPGKAELSDSAVYMRLARGFTFEETRIGTSISVGYLGEIYADFGFPGMLVGVAFLGLMMAGIVRMIMTFQLPWIMREGIVMAFALNIGGDGVERSLPKILGAMFMFFIVYIALYKFVLPRGVQWLDQRSVIARVKHS